MKAATNTISTVEPAVELLDHAGAVARGDHGEAGDRDLVAGMLGADRVELVDRD